MMMISAFEELLSCIFLKLGIQPKEKHFAKKGSILNQSLNQTINQSDQINQIKQLINK